VRTDLFDYQLPADRIAQDPRPRGSSRLLTLDRKSGSIAHRHFQEFPELLRSGDLLVRNDVRVRPTRLYGRDEKDRLVEIFLLRPLDIERRRWLALAKPGRRAKADRSIRFEEGVAAFVLEVDDEARRLVEFDRPIFDELLERIGHVPLPPYIRREPGAPDRSDDREGYQTIYAREPLAVAAPTAGLHFTEETVAALVARGVEVADLTLAVGAASFKPVTVGDTSEHRLEAEDTVLPAKTVSRLQQARAEGRRVVAVGTTVTRALEAWVRMPESDGSRDVQFSTDLFITPGFDFRVVCALLTNFHLPRSTLLMLVCAFGGRENVLAAYEEAIRQGYLFYSYGDAMFVSESSSTRIARV
jgi:S-adenosylmethionine:tRNA ribosyltransferase-isomerase